MFFSEFSVNFYTPGKLTLEPENGELEDDFLGGGFKHFLFSPLFGEMIQFDYCNIFQMG